MDVGCYCVSARAMIAGEPLRGRCGAGARRGRRRRGVRRDPALPRRRARAHRLRAWRWSNARSSRSPATRARSSSATPGTLEPVIELRAERASSGSRSSGSTRIASRSRTSQRRSAARPRRCSVVTTRWARRARSKRSTPPRPSRRRDERGRPRSPASARIRKADGGRYASDSRRREVRVRGPTARERMAGAARAGRGGRP